jgi:hypothetical protein
VPIQVGPGRWLVQPTERKHTVPPKIKRELAVFAIEHTRSLYGKRPGVDEVLAWTRRRAPAATLRRKQQSF